MQKYHREIVNYAYLGNNKAVVVTDYGCRILIDTRNKQHLKIRPFKVFFWFVLFFCLYLTSISAYSQVFLHPQDNETNDRTIQQTSLTTFEINDFLTQDVCLDINGDVLYHENPGTCTNRRDLKLGERTSYFKIDQLGVQAMVSFPSKTPNKKNLWVNTWDWGSGIRNNGNYSAVHYLDENSNTIMNSDGSIAKQAYLENTDIFSSPGTYDIMDSILKNTITGNSNTPIIDWVAISGTDRNYWVNDCNLKGETGAWLLFPENTVYNTLGSYVSELLGVAIDSNTCTNQRSQSVTSWIMSEKEYTNGLILPTITVIHTCNNDLDISNDCYEKFFFTKEFGFTRWERWQSDGLEQRPVSPNPMGCNDGWESNNHMWRKFCRDFAQVKYLPIGISWNPKSYPLNEAFGKGNLLINGDFAYRDMTGWNRHFSKNRPTEWNVSQAGNNNYLPSNHVLNVSCSECVPNIRGSVYQDILRKPDMMGKMSWGGDFFNNSNVSAIVILNLFQIGNTGNISVETKNFTILPNETYSFDGSFRVASSTTLFRWQMTAQTLGTKISIDNAYLTNW